MLQKMLKINPMPSCYQEIPVFTDLYGIITWTLYIAQYNQTFTTHNGTIADLTLNFIVAWISRKLIGITQSAVYSPICLNSCLCSIDLNIHSPPTHPPLFFLD